MSNEQIEELQDDYYHMEELRDCAEAEKEELQGCVELLEHNLNELVYALRMNDIVECKRLVIQGLGYIKEYA
jgi:hypothetical protein